MKGTFLFFSNQALIVSTLEQVWKIVFIVIQNTDAFSVKKTFSFL